MDSNNRQEHGLINSLRQSKGLSIINAKQIILWLSSIIFQEKDNPYCIHRDIIVTRDDTKEMLGLEKVLPKEFEIKDLENFKYFLKMKIARSMKGISVSQWKYMSGLLKETRMLGSKLADTPVDPKIKLGSKIDSTSIVKERY